MLTSEYIAELAAVPVFFKVREITVRTNRALK
jgi:hypothetical protein